jgi:hypothetical protein
MTVPVMLLLLGSFPLQPAGCDAQEVLNSPTRFVECARAGTERYKDRAVAIRDGYRRIGRDFPAMGEHWIRIGLIFDGKLDASRPEVLNYAMIGGKPQLLGVGYALPLLAGEPPPDGPAGQHAWHDHFRSIDDETLHPQHHAHGTGGDTPRLAMLHAWIWEDNPQGIFAADNWAIPFLRLGLRPSLSDSPIEAAKALSLLNGGRDYVEASLEAAGARNAAGQAQVALEAASKEVAAILRSRVAGVLEQAQLEQLATIWRDMWVRIDAHLDAAVRQRLASTVIR